MSIPEISPEDIARAEAAALQARARMGAAPAPPPVPGRRLAGGDAPVRAQPPPLPPFPGRQPPASDAVERLRREQERARATTARRVQEALACIPAAYASLTLETPALAARVWPGAAIEQARRSQDGPGGVFVGPSGSGKSTLASALLAGIVARDGASRSVAWIPARRLANARRDHPLGEIPEIVAYASSVDVLLLDELGGEEATFASSVGEVICDRYDAARVTWITTGFGRAAIRQRYGDGVTRRVFGREILVCARTKQALDEARELAGLR